MTSRPMSITGQAALAGLFTDPSITEDLMRASQELRAAQRSMDRALDSLVARAEKSPETKDEETKD